jgi:hypothetical protein
MSGKKVWNDPFFLIMACLTIGLAPFVPEPHIVGKVRWVFGGAVGMTWLDWWDFILHGTPWVLLMRWIILYFYNLPTFRNQS